MSFEQAVVNLEQTNAKLQEEVVRFRDAAMGLNNIYASVTEGRQAVGDGKYFSVPGGGAYMRLYRRQGGSAELIAEFPDRSELNNLIAQLGPLLGRDVVGGSGHLMAENAFGLGGSGHYIEDWNNTPNVNCFIAGSGNTLNKPPGGSTNGYQLSSSDGRYKKQYGSGINVPINYSRVYDNGVWSSWDPIVNESRLLQLGLGDTTTPLPSNSNWKMADLDSGLYHIISNNMPSDYTSEMGRLTWATLMGMRRTSGGTGGVLLQELSGILTSVRFAEGAISGVNRLWGTRNTTVDSNGFVKSASPIFRLSNNPETAASSTYGFKPAGCGAANSEAEGVTAAHVDIGVYVVTGSLGLALEGWTIEIPQDENGNRLCFIEAAQDDEGIITVRTYTRKPNFETLSFVAGDPVNIPDDRWIDLRLSMPIPEEPETNLEDSDAA